MTTTLSQAQLAGLYRQQKRIERDVREQVEQVRQWIDDGYDVPGLLRNAIQRPVGVLALPHNRARFDALYCDAFAQFGNLNDD